MIYILSAFCNKFCTKYLCIKNKNNIIRYNKMRRLIVKGKSICNLYG